jgi:formamidopyrimidine-DNA glycosylase
MPELPEIEITARLLDAALSGSEVESALAPGVNALKTFDPPLSAIEGQRFLWVRRRGKLFVLELDGGMSLVVHLMSAGRLQLFDSRASLRDRTSRLLVRLRDGRELRLREFGTRQRAWVKLLRTAQLSPFKRGSDLEPDEAARLREAIIDRLGGAIAHYQQVISLPIPDKLPMPLTVHRHNGEPCPRCGDQLEAVFYEDYVMCYCPTCQTEGKVLKDRRLSRLLK